MMPRIFPKRHCLEPSKLNLVIALHLILGFVGLVGGVAKGQVELAPVLELLSISKNYEEDFQGLRVRGSGALISPTRGLVGLHIGYGVGPFYLERVKVPILSVTSGRNYCVKVVSNDGAYWSLNSYQRKDDKNALYGIETRSKYKDLLSKVYSSSDIAIRVIASNTCTENSAGLLMPAILPGATSEGPLVGYINTPGDRITARLVDDFKRTIALGICKTDRDAVVFTEVCQFPIAENSVKAITKLEIVPIGSPDRAFTFEIQITQ
jgi:hypothetical protein